MLPFTCIPADNFTWAGKTGAADVSDLPECLISRVYRDAADAGFAIRSNRTGRVVLFTVTDSLHDRDGSFAGQVLSDTEGLGLTITIFND